MMDGQELEEPTQKLMFGRQFTYTYSMAWPAYMVIATLRHAIIFRILSVLHALDRDYCGGNF